MISIGQKVKTLLKLKDGKIHEILGEITDNQGETYRIRLINPIEYKDFEVYLLKSRYYEEVLT